MFFDEVFSPLDRRSVETPLKWCRRHSRSVSGAFDRVFNGLLRSWSFPLELIDRRLASIEFAHLAELQISNEDGDQYTEQAVDGVQYAEDYCKSGFGVVVRAGAHVELAGTITGRHDDSSKAFVRSCLRGCPE